jgi:hypothetical protein
VAGQELPRRTPGAAELPPTSPQQLGRHPADEVAWILDWHDAVTRAMRAIHEGTARPSDVRADDARGRQRR